MAVRPPQGGDDEPEAIAFGIAALDARLDEADVSFPATTEELVAALDEPAIPYDAAGNTLRLRAAIDELPRDRFESEQELLELLHPVFEAYRDRAGASIVARLRGLLPF
ncbi:hypothetical protein RYH80_07835 [Halobaculum sp. MBLA0147]|uniref:hypothetical protein n=1 Tax=Halobaculum sp. MBLA0147 TaxID=3079934 RepID=UPI003525D1CC